MRRRFWTGILDRAKGVIGELRKVVWPSRQETTRLTIIVLIVCVVMGLILGAFDYGFTTLFNQVLLGGR
jgi:preprotein translocase subunit SecE